jgi:cation diffusion facilitator family transporter
MLILVGAALIIYESVHRLSTGADVESLGIGIAVIGFSAIANGGVSMFLRRQARRHRSPALAGDAAHLGTDALASLGVLLGLVLVQLTGADAIDSAVAIAVAIVIVLRASDPAAVDSGAGGRAPPPAEMDRIEETIARARTSAPEVVGYHKLRARTTGRRRYIDLHVQFRDGTTLERAHGAAHELRDAIESELGDCEVLIHVEPESSRRDPAESPDPYRAG